MFQPEVLTRHKRAAMQLQERKEVRKLEQNGRFTDTG